MEKNLKVSIIIPVHNSDKTLDLCINSIVMQNYENIECILIENGSSDNSKTKCIEYTRKYNNVLFKSTEIMGVSNARNIGLEMASGDIIGFCDADDFLENKAISTVVDEFLKNRDVFSVFSGFNIGTIDSKGSLVKTYRGLKDRYITKSEAMQLLIIDDSVMGSVWNKYYKAELIKNKKFSDELSFCEDMHFNAIVLNSMEDTKKIKLISNPLYCYMDNPISVTHNVDIMFDMNDNLKYITALKKIENECDLNSETKGCLKMKIACFAIDYLSNYRIDLNKQNKLLLEVKDNYFYLIRYIYLNNFKWNIKRVLKGLKIVIKGG